MIYLQNFGISTALAAKIYQKYGSKVYEILETNPYKLADDIEGVGFKTADEIAAKIEYIQTLISGSKAGFFMCFSSP